MARRARGEVQRLLREAQELGRQAAPGTRRCRAWPRPSCSRAGLDAETLRAVTREQERQRGRRRRTRTTRAARAQRLEQRLADGQRLLDEGKATEAKVAFDEALDLDPANARALEGRARRPGAHPRLDHARPTRQRPSRDGKALFDAGAVRAGARAR